MVFYGASALILAVSLWAMISPDGAARTIGALVGWIGHGFGWWYFLVTTLFLVFVIAVAASRYGSVKLGPPESKPAFGIFSWAAMLFAAGIGIDLMFFSAAGPITHYLAPPAGDPETLEAARQGIVWTLLHYGITGWAMYALMGMALGYFAFRRGLPLSLRSALYPIIGTRVHGRTGDSVDIAAVLGTIFGISVSLGIGVVQLNYGLNLLVGLPEGAPARIGLIVLAVLMATVSAVAGVDSGIRRLSQLNIVLAAVLMCYILVYEDPVALLNALMLNIGDYLSGFPSMTLNTFAYDQPVEWLNNWTLFFWAWWIAWAPFVGVFLARISRGRTIRQFVAATLIVPFLFTATFLSVLGNSALRVVRSGNGEFGEMAMNAPEQGFYALLAEYPAFTFSAGLATLVGLLFYVTSADSGALVMGNFTTRPASPTTDAARWVRTFWAALTGLLTLAMLLVGGIDALTNATIIMGLPFSVVMVVIMAGVWRALQAEQVATGRSSAGVPAASVSRAWRSRLAAMLHQSSGAAIFIERVGRPALKQVAAELRNHGVPAQVDEHPDAGDGGRLDLIVGTDGAGFRYQLRGDTRVDPHGDTTQVANYSAEALIEDVLDHYERHLWES